MTSRQRCVLLGRTRMVLSCVRRLCSEHIMSPPVFSSLRGCFSHSCFQNEVLIDSCSGWSRRNQFGVGIHAGSSAHTASLANVLSDTCFLVSHHDVISDSLADTLLMAGRKGKTQAEKHAFVSHLSHLPSLSHSRGRRHAGNVKLASCSIN